jgi:hypothetical protein
MPFVKRTEANDAQTHPCFIEEKGGLRQVSAASHRAGLAQFSGLTFKRVAENTIDVFLAIRDPRGSLQDGADGNLVSW